MSNAISSQMEPFFLAVTNTNVSNITGDGTVYQCVFQNLLQSNATTASYNTSTGVFTALIQGLYVLTYEIDMGNLSASFTDGVVQLVTTQGTFAGGECNIGAIRAPAGTAMIAGTIINVPMNANDTAYVTIQVSGGTKVVYFGNGNTSTSCGGRLF